MTVEPLYSLYLHIPFCSHKCSYCDFNTYAGLEGWMRRYVTALCREIERVAESAAGRLPVHTIFFGGGTPSLLPLDAVAQVMDIASACFEIQPASEVTLEANPGTLSQDHLRGLRALGINRLSLGMQTVHPQELALLEREHDFGDVTRAVSWGHQAGFDDLNLDLIFGLPHQSLAHWQTSLRLAVDLDPTHLSLYALTLEHGTPLESWVSRGRLSSPDGDLAADMYEWASDFLAQQGYGQYEISNWARRDHAGQLNTCRHNLQYWRNLPYLGLGAGAHGYAMGIRTANVLSPLAYIRRCQTGEVREFPLSPATLETRPVARYTQMQETLLMGLRLTEEGVSKAAFQARFGQPLEEVFPRELARSFEQGLVEWSGQGALRLTPAGRLLGNQVFMRFVS